MGDASHRTASGSFEIAMTPGEGDDTPGVGRWTFEKTFAGDLAGTSRGQMLGAGDPATGCAGYVVIEMVRARLGGLQGGFALQHFGIMDAGDLRQQIEIVPGTGLDDLVGIAGTLTITQDDAGRHRYELKYALPE
ncbi:DUF3224 domain-containing protein [Allobranchiibius sp. GilTou38]|uniref:DUF3224 domain-containing protein n=1 Tax=Allobranchiibius sp. GilTou38 TaxID=2815210 RepID=UPI001AA14918|nr:DUF3224 domain-containing protein [Allobranchiibius sp. GilTou38]MBO1765623.1 DUF3224 domain-containing protein [Allobranchiibius sp. GilTou38]